MLSEEGRPTRAERSVLCLRSQNEKEEGQSHHS